MDLIKCKNSSHAKLHEPELLHPIVQTVSVWILTHATLGRLRGSMGSTVQALSSARRAEASVITEITATMMMDKQLMSFFMWYPLNFQTRP